MDTLDSEFIRNKSKNLNHKIVKHLSTSQIYKDYKRVFSKASGLPLMLQSVDSSQPAMKSQQENPICTVLRQGKHVCSSCPVPKLKQRANSKPVTLHCFTGICHTAVPIRVDNRVIAILKTGQILLHQPNTELFSKIAHRLLKWTAEIDLNSLECAYFQSKVLSQNQYEAFIQLLSILAGHLETLSNSILIKDSLSEPEAIQSAKCYASSHFYEPLTLEQVAKVVNMSVRNFCRVFKQSSGMTFIDYLIRLRVEQTKEQLLHSNKNISEIAFEVGFESLSQFNRSFKFITGKTPTVYRRDVKKLIVPKLAVTCQ